MEVHLIAGLISVVDPFHRHHLWGEKVGKFAEVDPVPQPLLQLCGRGQVLLQAGLHPPGRTHNKLSSEAKPHSRKLLYI